MPLFLLGLIGGVSGAAFVGGATDKAAKYAVIGGIGYLIYKKVK